MSASRSVAVTGPISPDQAWERYAVIDRWPSWSPPIERVEANEPRLTAGMTGVLYLLGGVQIGFVVNAVDHERRTWSWLVNAGPLSMTLQHEILERVGDGSVATLTVDGALPLTLIYPEVARLALYRLVH